MQNDQVRRITRRSSPPNNPAGVSGLGLTVSNPPTQAEVQALADKLDELIATLARV